MEWWILLALAAAALGAGAVARLRKLRRPQPGKDPENIYPLW